MFGGAGPSASTADPFGDPEEQDIPGSFPGGGGGADFKSWAWNYFTQNQSGGATPGTEGRQQQEDAQFSDVFEEMMQEEGMAEEGGRPTSKMWSILGGVSGGALGFIVANVPGALAGGVAGNRLGAVRDAKGKSVFAVFQVRMNVRIG